MSRQSRYAAILTLAVAVACAAPRAQADTREYPAAPFDALEASNGIRVTVVIGERASVTAEGPAAELDEVYVETKRGRLVVRPRLRRGDQRDLSRTIVRVVAVRLVDIESENGADATVTGLDVEAIELEATNGGTLTVSGACGRAEAVARRGGVLDAEQLTCAEVEARASTGGMVRAHAREAVDAGVSLGGEIEVSGSPARVRRGGALTGEIDIR